MELGFASVLPSTQMALMGSENVLIGWDGESCVSLQPFRSFVYCSQ